MKLFKLEKWEYDLCGNGEHQSTHFITAGSEEEIRKYFPEYDAFRRWEIYEIKPFSLIQIALKEGKIR